MKINSWSENSRKLINKDDIYKDFFIRTGASSIEHMGLAFFGNPKDYEFLKEIKKLNHVFTTGDSV